MADNSVREYLDLEKKYERVFALVGVSEDMNIDELRRALDDIYNAGRDKGRPETTASVVIKRLPNGFSAYQDGDNSRLIASSGSFDDLINYLATLDILQVVVAF